jgi:excinuclease UvrABC ATPase subunit
MASRSAPVKEFSLKQRDIISTATEARAKRCASTTRTARGRNASTKLRFSGVLPNLQRRYQETTSEYIRMKLEEFMSVRPCPTCGGKRLRPEALAVTIAGKSIWDITSMPVEESLAWAQGLQGKKHEIERLGDWRLEIGESKASGNGKANLLISQSPNPMIPPSPLTPRQQTIAHQVLKEIAARLSFMVNVGLDYLTLNRTALTLSGGESQRIRLATQIGSQLMGVLYILDEPSIGLHQRDNERLIEHAARHARPGQHGAGGGARRRHDPRRRLGGGHGAGRGRTWRTRGLLRTARRIRSLPGQPDRPVFARRTAHRRAGNAARGQRQICGGARRRRKQSARAWTCVSPWASSSR